MAISQLDFTVFTPPHKTYLEPFFGSGAVFFNKEKSIVETLNDIDGNIVNFFKVLREKPEELAWLISLTPWSREEYINTLTYANEETWFRRTGDELEDARRLLIRMWQSRGSKTSDRSGWRHDKQGRGGSSCPKEWQRIPKRIFEAAERLKEAQIENRPALDIIKQYGYPEVLIYADPPYPLSTRSKRMYAHEMSDTDHLELLEALDAHPGPVLLSGYASKLYDDQLKHWTRKTTMALAEGGRQREEVLWINPVAAKEVTENLFLFDSCTSI